MTLVEAHRFFRETFKMPFNDFLDGTLTILYGKPVIDIWKFDDWLHGQVGNYEKQGKSMRDVLEGRYGAAIMARFIDLVG